MQCVHCRPSAWLSTGRRRDAVWSRSASFARKPFPTAPTLPGTPHAPSDMFMPPAASWGYSPTAGKRHVWPLFGLEAPPPVTEAQRALARRMFGGAGGAKYLGDSSTMMAPDARPPTWSELAFIGRSNVGKSTLLNALLGSKHSFVPVSRHPGKTATVDFYGLGTSLHPSFVLVDTPGYGFSVRGRGAHEAWMANVSSYLLGRQDVLSRVAFLLDARTGLTEVDLELLSRLEQAHIPLHVILSKSDAVTQGALEAVALQSATILNKHVMPYPVLNAVSAKTGEGMTELQETLVQTARLHRMPKRC